MRDEGGGRVHSRMSRVAGEADVDRYPDCRSRDRKEGRASSRGVSMCRFLAS